MENREDFCARLGISEGTYANYERGDRIPDVNLITKVSLSEGISLDWLLLGEGPMRRNETPALPSDKAGTRKLIWNIAHAFWSNLPRRSKPEEVADQFVEMFDYLAQKDIGEEAAAKVIEFGAEQLRRSIKK
ncbi:helix-turn-helix domain-containing protein [Labrenzia suaedae]|uniref:Helix-turn-helix domain-containing protein n=1 Tax=Roseibium litorale TaxID=2803841 RepID=A0ABR9CII4_9HYPH|nr:helix-turn-helix domain-containing protein [Roseibium litorale]